jgi:1,2-diacylglycerol 3-alpha-glucosyltransferase
MKIALLCSGLGNIHRGHEVFARDLFGLLRDAADITLFKGGGEPSPGECVIDNIPRNSPLLEDVQVAASPKWAASAREQERLRIEAETFAYAALKPLLEGGFDIVHCLEQEVCNVVFDNRHLFRRTPKIVFSNGGAIPASRPPAVRLRAGTHRAQPEVQQQGEGVRDPARRGPRALPARHSDRLPRSTWHSAEDAFVVISVGTICYHHKRMDYVIREVAALETAHLASSSGQESQDSHKIKELGPRSDGKACRLCHASRTTNFPQAYAAADAFVLGSLFETFGIVYIEALAMGAPGVLHRPSEPALDRARKASSST